ncbi:PAS domain-containing protein [Planctomycetota bacterium]
MTAGETNMDYESLSKPELIEELSKMQQRISSLEVDAATARAKLDDLIHSNPAVIYMCKAEGDFGATFISNNIREQFGYEPHEFTETPTFWADHIHPGDRERVFAELVGVFEHGHQEHEYRFRRKDGEYVWVRDELRLILDPEGQPREIAGYWIDINDRKLAEAATERLNEELAEHIEAQRQTIHELSTPTIELWQGIAFLPVVGFMDTARIRQMMDNLLDHIARTQAEIVIIDVTGLPVFDSSVAQHFLRTVQAAAMLGCEAIITGIRPNTAQTLIRLGVDVENLRTLGKLHAGIVEAFRLTNRKVVMSSEHSNFTDSAKKPR